MALYMCILIILGILSTAVSGKVLTILIEVGLLGLLDTSK